MLSHRPRPALQVGGKYSYPNLIPLSDAEVRHIVETLRGYPPRAHLQPLPGRVTTTDEPAALQRSAERYLAHR